MITLGKLTKVKDLRKIWNSEARDFTPWLAQEENLEILSNEIGLDIELIETEAKIGSFNTDILAKDTYSDDIIIIENQLEQTDHDHLGKIITYASGHNANTIIWIVKDVREEHRQAIDWLNEHTDKDLNIFLIKIELWKIDDSSIAPKFNIISSPNNWTKTVKSSQSPRNNITDLKLTQLDYWTKFFEYLDNNDTPFNPRKPQPRHWYDLPIGNSLCHISLTMNSRKNALFNYIYIDNDKELFDYLSSQKDEIEKEMGITLDWKRLNNKKASIIEIKHDNIDPLNEENWDRMIKIHIGDAEKFYFTFKDRVKEYMNKE